VNHQITIATLYLLMGLVSLLMYDGKKVQTSGEAERRPMNSVSTFRYVYRLSQLTYLYALVLFFMGKHELTLSLFHNLATFYAGAWISVVGIVLFIGAKTMLGQHYSHCSKMYMPKDIVMEGIYGHIRHPIYTANLIIIFGLFVATGDLFVLTLWCTMLGYYHRSARLEELDLQHEFPSYGRYMERTGRFLPRPLQLLKSLNSIREG
jgi:protein-S-isoprenylcysteine O-methyltransferase Ste14